MVESTAPQSRVRDLTSATRRIPIEIDGVVSYEVINALWTTFNRDEKRDSFDLGPGWHRKIEESTPPDLAEEIRALGGPSCAIWLSLLGMISTAPHPHDPDRVFAWLARVNPMRLRRSMLGYLSHSADASLIEEAAEGDLEALTRLLHDDIPQEKRDHLVTVFEIEPEELRDRMVGALGRFRSEVFAPYEADYAAAIGRAAASRRATATKEGAKEVIEEVTRGLDYEIPLGVSRVILIPSVVLRPLSLIDQHRDTLLVVYAMADEFIDSDPQAPPSWLVRTYKALSDERRLRILRRLSEGETTLDELTEMLGLSKSTVHHHISLLRAAGLVRVHIGDEKRDHKTYELREQALTNAGAVLDTYVRSNEQAVS